MGAGDMTTVFNPARQNPKLKDHARELRANSTDAEKALWQKIRGQQLGARFRRQHIIEPFIVDFYCVEVKLAIELDGGQHGEAKDKRYDEQRARYLESMGIFILRFWNNDVLRNIDGVMSAIAVRIESLKVSSAPPP